MTFEMLIFGLYKALPVSLIVIYYVCENLFRFIYLSLFIYFNLLPIKAARPHEGFHNKIDIPFGFDGIGRTGAVAALKCPTDSQFLHET